MKVLFGVFLAFLVVIPCQAKLIIVGKGGDANYSTIQEAINNSWHGDIIVVKPGTYGEKVVFIGRAVTVTSENPDDVGLVQATTIVTSSGYSVVFDFGEGSGSVLTGFTITGRGVYCDGASPTIAKNVIRNCANRGIHGYNSAAPAITGNTIVANGQEGVYGCDGPISANTISGNSAGVAFCNGPIAGNVISGNADGGGLYFCDGKISGNVISGNYSIGRGGGLYGCGGDISNNVVAGNKAGLSGGGLYDCTKSICNNTIVGNVTAGNGGGLDNCASIVCNNIIAFNQASFGGAIHGLCNSTYNSFWMNEGGNFGGGSKAGVGDFITDPLFASEGYWDDNGTADEGDDSWVDGDYHLKSEAGRWDASNGKWVVDPVASHCIDAGDPSADWTGELWPHGRRLNLGAYGGTPEASMSLAAYGNVADLDNDAAVGYADLGLLTKKWLWVGALLAEDLDRDGVVDFNDFIVLADNWRVGPPPPKPPIPDPMTWAVKPYGTSPYTIAMVATTATSTDGSGVEYYFEDWLHRAYNSGWVWFPPGVEARWEDTGLLPDSTYYYRVKARNRANLLETGWSEVMLADTLREDETPPTPNPAKWQTEPYAASPSMIRMAAETATDESGVEYQFECTSHPVYSSGWQDSSVYEVSVPKGHYSFRVRARDKSINRNATAYSILVTVDLEPPTPDPAQWEEEPHKIRIGEGTFNYYATMTAAEATDESGGVQYYFRCTNESGFSSGWQSDRTYTVHLGGSHVIARFQVKARDISPSHNETGYSYVVPAQ